MSNVRIEATGDFALTVEVTLGANVRKTHKIAAGDSIELSVAGNQKLSVSGVSEDAAAAEPEAIAVGADVTEPETAIEGACGGSEPLPAVEGAGEAPSGDISEMGELTPLGEGIDNPFATPEQ